ncbi:MAG: rRNA maturation RNase YbeY [Fermentimonas sp.]|jgi:probable rRNA maturation factor
MAVTFHAEGVDFPAIDKKSVADWIRSVAKEYGKRAGEIAYLFCDDEKILMVNQQFLGHDYYTDIITFDYTEDDCLSGDIFISIDTVRSNAKLYRVSFQEELHRVMIHGILHLCEMGDESEKEEKAMREAENRALEKLTFLLSSRGVS